MSRARNLRLGLATWTAVLTGCATHVPQVLSPRIVPQSFVGQDAGKDSDWPKPAWWQQFGSPELSEFIVNAQTDNRDLAVAAAGVVEAHAQTIIQRASLFPQLNLQGQAERSKPGSGSTSISSYPSGNSFGLTLGASYEVDVWGLARNNLRAATETL
jgi:outer membrane protein, multidrug efflux system